MTVSFSDYTSRIQQADRRQLHFSFEKHVLRLHPPSCTPKTSKTLKQIRTCQETKKQSTDHKSKGGSGEQQQKRYDTVEWTIILKMPEEKQFYFYVRAQEQFYFYVVFQHPLYSQISK